MLKNYLSKDSIQLTDSVNNWKEGIKLSAQPLLENNIINESYINAMINNVIQNGNYIIIVPEIAIPHTKRELGALNTGISLLKLDNPVLFPKDVPVKMFITLASKDDNGHLEMLSDLTDILSNQDYITELLNAKTKDEIVNTINKTGE